MSYEADPSIRRPRPDRTTAARRWSGQTITTVVSAAVVVVLGVLLTVTPVPFVSWAPGTTLDVLGSAPNGAAVINVAGVTTYPVTGELRMTTISVTRPDAHLFLPQALVEYWLPGHDVLPRDSIYPPNKSSGEIQAENVRMMDTSKRDAVAAALRAAGLRVTEYPSVIGIVQGSAADGTFELGDLILKVDGAPVQTTDDIRAHVDKARPGDGMTFELQRDGKHVNLQITLGNHNDRARIGLELGPGYVYAATVTYGVDPAVVGPSAGLIFALAIYDKVTEPDLLAGAVVAGTGTIAPDGNVGSIGGIQEKIRAAEKAHASIFLVPAGNCGDLAGVQTSMTLVKVDTLKNAISALQLLQQNPSAAVPRC